MNRGRVAKTFDLRLLRAFLTVADRESFTNAAEVLHQTQSTVSQQVRRLEEHLGKPLFTRNTRQVVLTPEGETLLDYARTMLRLSEEAHDKLNVPELRGRLRIAVAEDLATHWLAPLLSRFGQRHEGVKLDVQVGLTETMLGDMQHNRFDLVLGKRIIGCAQGEAFGSDQLVWAGRIDERAFQGGRPIPLALFAEGCVYRRIALEALTAMKQPWEIVYTSPSLAGIHAAVRSGIAVSPLASGFLGELPVSKSALLPPLAEVEFAIFTSTEHPLSEIASHFRQLIRDAHATSTEGIGLI